MRAVVLTVAIASAIGLTNAQAPMALAQAGGGGRGASGGRGTSGGRGGGRGGTQFTGPSVSVRTVAEGQPRTSAATWLGWRVGVRTDAFGPLTFSEAAAKADAGGLAYVEGVSTQKVSAEITKNLDYNLTTAEVDKVKARLNELRLRMPAYDAGTIPGDPVSRRKLFDFAKGLGVDTIIGSADGASLADLDKLATESAINVALVNKDAKSTVASVANLGKRIGVSADIGTWMDAGVKPLAGLAQLKDRLVVANLRDRSALGARGHNVTLGTGVAGLGSLLMEMAKQQPPSAPANYPPPPGTDGGATRAEINPVFFALDPAGAPDMVADLNGAVAAFDKALPAVVYYRADALSRVTPISTPDKVPADQKQRITAAIPRQALVKPKKPRKLLVVDLDMNGSFYHGSTPIANLSLSLMSEYTGAFTPTFSNDLDNLKYPKIKQWDAVYLNNIQGAVFTDPETINGLLRFVKEGGGVAVLHATTFASGDVKEFGELIGATSGAHKYNGEPGTLRVDDPNSPLTKQWEGKGFDFFDEYYHFVPTGPYSRTKVHVLLSMDPDKKELTGNQYTNRPDNDYAMAWVRAVEKGRVFTCALGHRPEFYETSKMQQMILAGVQFVLGDLETDTTPNNQPTPYKK